MDNISLTGKKYPEKKFRVGAIQVAIWRNESKEGNKFYSVSVEKGYKKEDKWYSTTNFNSNDIPKVVLALQEAYKYMNLKLSAKEIIDEAKEELGVEMENYETNESTKEGMPHQRFVEEESVTEQEDGIDEEL
jgi:adenosylcobinamide amidohydrolase